MPVWSYQAQILVFKNAHRNKRIVDVQLPDNKGDQERRSQNDQGNDISSLPSLWSSASNTEAIVSNNLEIRQPINTSAQH
jgi:hypothetical protein